MGAHDEQPAIRPRAVPGFRSARTVLCRSGADLLYPGPQAVGRRVRVLIASHQPIVVPWPARAARGRARARDRRRVGRWRRRAAVGPAACGRVLVLIDMGIQTLDAIAVTRTIRSELPDTHVIVISGGNDDVSAVESRRAGATAYLRREARIEDLLRAIRSAVAGQVMIPARAVARLLHSMGRHQALSERETEVLYLVARGLANKQVARDLGIAESTVKCHVSGILKKPGCRPGPRLPSTPPAACWSSTARWPTRPTTAWMPGAARSSTTFSSTTYRVQASRTMLESLLGQPGPRARERLPGATLVHHRETCE